MPSTIDIPMGDLAVSKSDDMTLATFVGSCVAICLFDPIKKVGGLAHVMLPHGEPSPNNTLPAKFANVAIETLLIKMIELGSKQRNIKAKLVGGAQIFSNASGDGLFSIGQRNVQYIHEMLDEKSIPILAENIGSNHGRWVRFEIATGSVGIRNKKKMEIMI